MSKTDFRPSVKPLPDRSATLRFWQRAAQHYQALGISQFLRGESCPFPRSSFAAIHWRKGIVAALAAERGGVA